METNLLNGIENLQKDKRSKFIKDTLTLSDLRNRSSYLSLKNINDILISLLDTKEPYGLSVESMYLIYKNIISEFKNFNITENESLSKQSIIFQVFENTAKIIALDLKKNTLDLSLTEIYDFYKDMFDFVEKKIWNVKLRNMGSLGFVEFYNILENLNYNLYENNKYPEDKKAIKDMFEGMKLLKEKIVPLEFDYKLRNYADFHSKEEVKNNLISNNDKVMYFYRIKFEVFFKDFLENEVNDFLQKLKAKELNSYESISETVQTDDYIEISFDRNDPNNRVLANKLNLFIENNKIKLQNTDFFTDPKKLHFALRFKNKKNTELEAGVFKEFIRSVVEFLTKNYDIENAGLEINELMRELDNSLREVELLSKLEGEKPQLVNKKKKI